MNFLRTHISLIIIVILVVLLAVSLLWNRPVLAPGTVQAPVVSPVTTSVTNTPVTSTTKSPAPAPVSTKTGGSNTNTVSSSTYYPRGTKIDLPLYNTDNPTDTIRVNKPALNTTVNSPLEVTGETRGGWYFEGTFPIVLTDSRNHVLARGLAKAQSDWTSPDFVSFKTVLNFAPQPTNSTGKLFFQKDNPSGLPQNDAYAEIDVTFF